MELFKEIFGDKNDAYKAVSEYEMWIGFQKVKIKIIIDLGNSYAYHLSHHYWGKNQMGPYQSSVTHGFRDEKDALFAAKRELFLYYDPNDSEAKWEINDNY